jgi:mannan endo-1,4-beta-mannosidase
VQATVKVTALRSVNSWAASFSVPQGAVLNQSWSAKVVQAGTKLTATNETWNGKLAAGASTEFGLILKGGGTAVPAVACTGA